MHKSELNTSSSSDYFDGFRKLYYHLYSNSSASRAERIIGDLSKLLLVALCKTLKPYYKKSIEDFLLNKGVSNELLLPILQERYSKVFGPDDKFYLDENSLRYGLAAIANLDINAAKSHLLGDAF